MFTCEKCGALFDGRKRRFCSAECRDGCRRYNDRPTEFVCKGCGQVAPVKPAGPLPEYCGGPCRARAGHVRERADGRYEKQLNRIRAKAAKTRAERPPITCPECGVEFSATNPRQKYCAPKCGSTANYKVYAADGRNNEASRRWKAANSGQVKEAQRKYQRENRHIYNAADERRRARKANAEYDGHTADDFYRYCDDVGMYSCVYCGNPGSDSERLAMDHVFPLSKGGPHTLGNLVLACRSCNSRKKDQYPWEFVAQLLAE